ncbi:MAG: hypothetical protein AAB368_12230, partial [bacterium]
APNPTVDLTASSTLVDYGSTAVLSWTSTHATSCLGDGFSAGLGTVGSIITDAIYSTRTFRITCMNNSGDTETDSVTISARTQENNQEPIVDLSADRTNVSYGGSTSLRWNSTYATSCRGSGGTGNWSGDKSLDGVYLTGELTNSVTYTIICTNNYGSKTDSIFIDVDSDSQDQAPSVSTSTPTNIGYNYATLNGYVNSNGNINTRAWFEWGTGTYYGNQTNQVNYGSGSSNYSYDIGGLAQNTTYYYRAVAQGNNGQLIYGGQRTFVTTGDNNNNSNPLVTTYPASLLTNNIATLNGYVDPNNTTTNVWFQWGTSYSSLYSSTTSRYQSARGNFSDLLSNL